MKFVSKNFHKIITISVFTISLLIPLFQPAKSKAFVGEPICVTTITPYVFVNELINHLSDLNLNKDLIVFNRAKYNSTYYALRPDNVSYVDNNAKLVANSTNLQTQPALNKTNNNIVWVDKTGNETASRIVGYLNPTEEVVIISDSSISAVNTSPDYDGSFVVWEGQRLDNGAKNIFLRQIQEVPASAITHISAATNNQLTPKISGDYVVWLDTKETRKPYIVAKNIKTMAKDVVISSFDSDKQAPQTNGQHVVWMDNRNGNWDIYLKNLNSNENEIRLSTQPGDNINPQITKHMVVWYNTSNSTIYAYVFDTQKTHLIMKTAVSVFDLAAFEKAVTWVTKDTNNNATLYWLNCDVATLPEVSNNWSLKGILQMFYEKITLLSPFTDLIEDGLINSIDFSKYIALLNQPIGSPTISTSPPPTISTNPSPACVPEGGQCNSASCCSGLVCISNDTSDIKLCQSETPTPTPISCNGNSQCEQCKLSGGNWEEFGSSCADNCNAGDLCTQVTTTSCNCPASACWNGTTCQFPSAEITNNTVFYLENTNGKKVPVSINIDGSNKKVWGKANTEYSEIAVSPDGKYIAYIEIPQGNNLEHLVIKNIATNQETVITNDNKSKAIRFSPEGNSLYYLNSFLGYEQIFEYVINNDSSYPVYSDNKIRENEYTLSYNTDYLAFNGLTASKSTSDIYIYIRSSNQQIQITNDNLDDSQLQFISNTKWIVYTNGNNDQAEIIKQNMDGRERINLTNNSFYDGWPNVSSDGSKITFLSTRSGKLDLYVMDIDGKNIKNLTNGKYTTLEKPKFSANNKTILFISNSKIYKVNSDGSDLKRLTTSNTLESSVTTIIDNSAQVPSLAF